MNVVKLILAILPLLLIVLIMIVAMVGDGYDFLDDVVAAFKFILGMLITIGFIFWCVWGCHYIASVLK